METQAIQKEYVLTKQLLKSSTAIGALAREAQQAESSRDFIHKLNISLKEAQETEYWLLLLKEIALIQGKEFMTLHYDCVELIRILTAIIKSSRSKPLPHQ